MEKYPSYMTTETALNVAEDASMERLRMKHPAACMALANEVYRLTELIAQMNKRLPFDQQEWIKASIRLPKKEDANGAGEVLCFGVLVDQETPVQYVEQWDKVLGTYDCYWRGLPMNPPTFTDEGQGCSDVF